MLNQVPAVRNLLRKCVRCGKCRSVCPIFREIKTEVAAPRAHVFLTQLLRDEELAPDASVAARADRCLLCKSCSVECPSGIPVDQMVIAMRNYLRDYNKNKTKQFLLSTMFKDQKSLKRVRLLLKSYQATGLKNLVQKSGLLSLVSEDLMKVNKLLAPVAGPLASSVLPEIAPAKGKRRIRVGYFLGCATNLFYPQRASAVIEVLTHNGCEVVTPKELQCCGMPHIANGNARLAKEMTEHNFKLFKKAGVEVIVSDCASCSSMLQGDYYDQLFDELPQEIAHFKGKIFDINKFLIDMIDLNENLASAGNLTVTYHDPCHLVKGQGVKEEPRKILRSVPGVNLVEMDEADQCCGGAGTFSISYYDLSLKILNRKINNIQKTGADLIATSCPACSMQLTHGLTENGLTLQVIHPVEILARGYKGNAADKIS